MLHGGSLGTLLRGEGERTHPLHAGFPQEVAQLLKFFLTLAGQTGNQAGANDQTRDIIPQLLQQRPQERAIAAAVHQLQNLVVAVLDGNIQVFDNLRLLRHHPDEFIVNFIGVDIMHPHPMQPLNLAQPVQQLRQQPGMFRKIRAIAAGVLRHHNQLLHAGISKLLCLCQHVLHPPGAVLAPQGGNHAIGALVVASFGNLDVSIVLGGGENAPGLHLRGIDAAEIANRPVFQQLFNGGDNLCVAARAQQTVHLRHFLCNLSLIALGEAAGNQNLANLALGFHGTGHENVVNCL